MLVWRIHLKITRHISIVRLSPGWLAIGPCPIFFLIRERKTPTAPSMDCTYTPIVLVIELSEFNPSIKQSHVAKA